MFKNTVTIQRDLGYFIGFVETQDFASLHCAYEFKHAEYLQKNFNLLKVYFTL